MAESPAPKLVDLVPHIPALALVACPEKEEPGETTRQTVGTNYFNVNRSTTLR